MVFFKKKDWTKDEKRIIELLLQGDTKFLQVLRKQVNPPFFLWVERRTPSNKLKPYSTPANEYKINIVFDGRLRENFSANDNITAEINDLEILESNLNTKLQVIGTVHKGVLINIRFLSTHSLKWPKYLRLGDWNFKTEDGSHTKQRRLFVELDKPIEKIYWRNLPNTWVKKLLGKINNQEINLGLHPMLDIVEINALENGLNITLPNDFKEFLLTTNGVTISESKVFGRDALYLLEKDVSETDNLLVFVVTDDGSPLVLDLTHLNQGSSTCPIIYFNHETNEKVILAESFKEWLTKFVIKYNL